LPVWTGKCIFYLTHNSVNNKWTLRSVRCAKLLRKHLKRVCTQAYILRFLLTPFHLCYRPLHKQESCSKCNQFILFSQAFTLNATRIKTAYQVQNVRLWPTAPPVPTYPRHVNARKTLKKTIMNAVVSTVSHSSRSCVNKVKTCFMLTRISSDTASEVQHNVRPRNTAFLKPLFEIRLE
jgi:hypothetical protein